MQSLEIQEQVLFNPTNPVGVVEEDAMLACLTHIGFPSTSSLGNGAEDSDAASSIGYSLSSCTASTSASQSSSDAGSPLCSPSILPDRTRSVVADDIVVSFYLETPHTLKLRRTNYAAHLVRKEAKALLALADRMDQTTIEPLDVLEPVTSLSNSFTHTLDLLSSMDKHGKLVFIGIGKSGLLAKKAVATFNSLGIQSVFLHPVEALHGDMGLVSPHGIDTIVPISYSGKTKEILSLTALLRQRGCHAVVSVTKPYSPLAVASDACLDASVEDDNEADDTVPEPTSSVLVALSLLDSLALTLLRIRTGWDTEGSARRRVFGNNHPGGNLGHILLKQS